MTPFHFIIFALACYRLTVLVVRDLGPFNVFAKARARIKMLACPYCVSIWIGAVIVCLTATSEPPIVAACIAFALSAVAIMLDRAFRE